MATKPYVILDQDRATLYDDEEPTTFICVAIRDLDKVAPRWDSLLKTGYVVVQREDGSCYINEIQTKEWTEGGLDLHNPCGCLAGEASDFTDAYTKCPTCDDFAQGIISDNYPSIGALFREIADWAKHRSHQDKEDECWADGDPEDTESVDLERVW